MKRIVIVTLLGVLLLFLIGGTLLLSRPEFADSIFHPEDAGLRTIVHDANKDVSRDAAAVGKVLAKKDAAGKCTDAETGTTDWRCWQKEHNPWAAHVAQARWARGAQIAEANGQYMKTNDVWLPSSMKTWMATDIPIYSCMFITARGQTTYGTYEAGPAGVDLSSFTPRNRESWLTFNKGRPTLVPGFLWGTVMGKSCDDAEGKKCGDPFPIAQGAYVSASQVGGGHNWVILNGFVSPESSASGLNGIPKLVMSDYNAYEGGFRIDWEKAPDDKCSASTLVASR